MPVAEGRGDVFFRASLQYMDDGHSDGGAVIQWRGETLSCDLIPGSGPRSGRLAMGEPMTLLLC